jgi:hypothetical protein
MRHVEKQKRSLPTVSLTTPPPSAPLSLKTLHPSNPFKKKLIVLSYCFLSVTSIVIDWKMALVSLNSGKVPTAASALDGMVEMERAELADSRACFRMDRRVTSLDVSVLSDRLDDATWSLVVDMSITSSPICTDLMIVLPGSFAL